MSAGFKPEYNAYLSRLVISGQREEARKFVERVRESSARPTPVVLGEYELYPTPDAVTHFMLHVFEGGPPECEQFIRRWYPDAAAKIGPTMPVEEQARLLFQTYHPRAIATGLRAFYPERAARFIPRTGKK